MDDDDHNTQPIPINDLVEASALCVIHDAA